MKPRRMRIVAYIARVREVTNAYKSLAWKRAVKRHSGDMGTDGEIWELGCYDVDWIHLVCRLL
jgi:hypothetical protein